MCCPALSNGLDTRVGLTDSAGTKTFQRDGVGVTAPVLTDGTATFTASGENRGGVKTTFSSALKNTDLQTSATGAVTAERQYDAFGNVIASSGAWTSQFGNAGRFGYQEDPDSGLKLLGHRYYDSSTGRFLTRDPIKDGRNWYSYCENSPVSHFDAQGLSSTALQIGGGLFRLGAQLGLTPAGQAIMLVAAVVIVVVIIYNALPKETVDEEPEELSLVSGGLDPTPGSNHSPAADGAAALGAWAAWEKWKSRRGFRRVYRVYGLGGGTGFGGRWWSFEDPRLDPSGYAWRYGLTPFDGKRGTTGDGWVSGIWLGGGGGKIEPADPAVGYPGSGGGIELEFPEGGPGWSIIPTGGGILNPPAVIQSRVKRAG